ncbi:hypothetical protein BDV97DRAFT_204766 [Delphinella strobiligena]|nr:hypothetical protein BDV97DRAFT_204766 [Delphinella strobiligena]
MREMDGPRSLTRCARESPKAISYTFTEDVARLHMCIRFISYMTNSFGESFHEAHRSMAVYLHYHGKTKTQESCILKGQQCESTSCSVFVIASGHLFRLVYYTMRLFLAQLWKWEREWDPGFDEREHENWWTKVLIGQLYQYRLWRGPSDRLVDSAKSDMVKLAFMELASLDGTELSTLYKNHLLLWGKPTELPDIDSNISPIEVSIDQDRQNWVEELAIMPKPRNAKLSLLVQQVAEVMSMERFQETALKKTRNCISIWRKNRREDGTIEVYMTEHLVGSKPIQ